MALGSGSVADHDRRRILAELHAETEAPARMSDLPLPVVQVQRTRTG